MSVNTAIPAASAAVMEAQGVSKHFGGMQVLRDCDLTILRGEIVALVGPNGAGKTTLFNIMTGLVRPSSGRVLLEGVEMAGASQEAIARRGAVKTFQVPREFESLTVLENLLVAGSSKKDASVLRALFKMRRIDATDAERIETAVDIVKFLGLERVIFDRATTLSTGQKKLLDVGRAMMLDPKILLLDEPLAGVTPRVAAGISDRLSELKERGYSIALIEHRLDFISKVCQRMYVLAEGQILISGEPDMCLSDQRVVDAFLGVELI